MTEAHEQVCDRERDFALLLEKYLDGALFGTERLELRKAITENPAWSTQFVDVVVQESLFRETIPALLSETSITDHKLAEEPLRLRWYPWPRLAAAAALLLAATGLFTYLLCRQPGEGSVPLRVSDLQGVVIRRGGSSLAMRPGLTVRNGDVIDNGSAEFALLQYTGEDTEIKMIPGAVLHVSSRTGKRLFLSGGTIAVDACPQTGRHSLTLTTSDAEAGIVGTRYLLTANAEGTRIDVSEGSVDFKRLSDGASVKVGTGQYAVAADHLDDLVVSSSDPAQSSLQDDVAYAESFERDAFTNGFPIAGTDGWYGDADDAVISTDSAVIAALSAYTNAGYSYPIDTNHTKVLHVADAGQITNQINGITGSVVYTDFLLMPSYSTAVPPGIDADYQLAFYVAANGKMVIWHSYTNGGSGEVINEWHELDGGPTLSSNAWSRVTIEQDYDNDMFRVRVNQAAATTDPKGWSGDGGNPTGSWFHMVQTGGQMNEFSAWKSTYLDDLVVTYSDPVPTTTSTTSTTSTSTTSTTTTLLKNDVPYAEPFERAGYTNGFPIAGTNGWFGDADDAVISTDSAVIAALSVYTGAGHSYPIATDHSKVLEVLDAGQITDLFNATIPGSMVYTDFLLLPTYSESAPSGVGTNHQLAFYVAANGKLVIWHSYTNMGTGEVANEWHELSGGPMLDSNAWSRMTIEQDYANNMFRVRVNEVAAITDPKGWDRAGGNPTGSWFYMVQTDGNMKEFSASESTYLDDLVVSYGDPLWPRGMILIIR